MIDTRASQQAKHSLTQPRFFTQQPGNYYPSSVTYPITKNQHAALLSKRVNSIDRSINTNQSSIHPCIASHRSPTDLARAVPMLPPFSWSVSSPTATPTHPHAITTPRRSPWQANELELTEPKFSGLLPPRNLGRRLLPCPLLLHTTQGNAPSHTHICSGHSEARKQLRTVHTVCHACPPP